MSQVLQRRKFVLYYPPEFVGGERVEIKVGMRFFTEENGFRLPEIGYINAQTSSASRSSMARRTR